jgi:hypothetical protein
MVNLQQRGEMLQKTQGNGKFLCFIIFRGKGSRLRVHNVSRSITKQKIQDEKRVGTCKDFKQKHRDINIVETHAHWSLRDRQLLQFRRWWR